MTEPLRHEWAGFRRPGRLIALTVAALAVVAVSLLSGLAQHSTCSEGPVEVPCPPPDNGAVSDTFVWTHRPLGEQGSITVRLTSMTGIITYPPPNHDSLVPGLVPWAKAGIIIKDGQQQGSAYAALMLTGSNGVRFQHDYTHDVAGRPGGVSPGAPRWLRLTRSGAVISGYESTDGTQWTQVGSATLPGLPNTVQVGLFACSPGDLTIKRVALGGGIVESRFTQTTAVFDRVGLDGAPAATWTPGQVGEMGHTDWEKYHQPSEAVETNGTFTVSGTGDIGPVNPDGGPGVASTLTGLSVSLIIVLVVAVRYASRRPVAGRTQAAKATVIGGAGLVVGVVAAGLAIPIGTMVLRANGTGIPTMPILTAARVIAGVGGLTALSAVFALALGTLLRRWLAIVLALALLIVPYLLAALPLLPDAVAQALLRFTPAAGFAVLPTVPAYPQVTAHLAPSAGYFPLPWWAGLTVLATFTALTLTLARTLTTRPHPLPPSPPASPSPPP